jgi:hypothetical protein
LGFNESRPGVARPALVKIGQSGHLFSKQPAQTLSQITKVVEIAQIFKHIPHIPAL